MRRRGFVFLLCLVVFLALPGVVHAAQAGAHRGYVLYTDIRVFIDDIEILGYNINGRTYVLAMELAAFGFDVRWNEEIRRVDIVRGTSTMAPPPVPLNMHPEGSVAFAALYTDIVAYMDGMRVDSFHAMGRTIVRVTDLAAVFGDVAWDDHDRTVHITLVSPLSASSESEPAPATQFAITSAGNLHGVACASGAVIAPMQYTLRQATMLKHALQQQKRPATMHLTHWFDDGLRDSLPRHVPLAILDLLTGIKYYVASFSNGNHADVETLTAVDTELMFATQPASWSGRPVWVFLPDGRVIPAAIHTMPHDVWTIRDNNLNGHICLHFYGSRQHVSPASPYAYMIAEAYATFHLMMHYLR